MESCYIFMVDAALEKCRQTGNSIDMIISPSRFPPLVKKAERWDAQYVSPTDRIAF